MLALADIVLLIHLAFVVFVMLGGILVMRWSAIAWLHLPAISWGAGIEFTGGICPLTRLEQMLQQRAGVAPYEGGFVEHYVTAILYPIGLTRELQVLLGLIVVTVNLSAYMALLRHRRRRQINVPPSLATKCDATR